jgi:DNA-binding transcriptional ArsR family regulator
MNKGGADVADFDYPDEFLEHISSIFQAFGNTTRLRIFRALHNNDEGLSVNELHDRVGTSRANISKHLGVMESEGLLGVRNEGTARIYFIADEEITRICEKVCDYVEKRLQNISDIPTTNSTEED